MSDDSKRFQRVLLLSKLERDAIEPPAFKSKEPGEARALGFEKRQLQRELDSATSHFLKARGYLASGFKRGAKKIPGL